jgi:hypothetical protein
MSYAYEQLRLATLYLSQSGPLHERLAKALSESFPLRPKDLPIACRKEFCLLLDRFSLGTPTNKNTALAMKIKAMSDQEVHAIVHTLLHLYDTVARYQPLPPVETCSK